METMYIPYLFVVDVGMFYKSAHHCLYNNNNNNNNNNVFYFNRMNSTISYTNQFTSKSIFDIYFTEFGAAFDNCFTCFVQVLL